ncbi:MAG: flagellar basal body rod protein FlgB [Clostridiales bacterium]|jgi:flagellar basal-body rod protein FlgB|nr:flagellar basal body rod protein FlgB [Clostridiales bacterium]
MRIENMFDFTNIMGTAMQGTVARGAAISNNIANVDTPRFKRSVVSFEDQLQSAVNDFRRTGNLDLSGFSPRTFVEFDHLSYRWDLNNVDIELEMAQLYANNMRFNIMQSGIMNHYRIINMVIGMQ